jgi:serine/threonine protein kinase
LQGTQKLVKELESWRQLAHPNICRLFEVHETPMAYAFVSEICEGGDLLERINEYGFMAEPEAKTYFRQLVSAVAFCHERGIVHRDLKLENILVDGAGQIKLADFGFAGFYDVLGRKRMYEYCGSPPYAAPEIFMGRPYIGPEIDAWSLGVVLYALCTGSLPFTASNLEELGSQVVEGRFDKPFFLSPDLVRVICGLMQVNANRRFTLAEVRASPWDGCPDSGVNGDAASPSLDKTLTPYGGPAVVVATAAAENSDGKAAATPNPRRELFGAVEGGAAAGPATDRAGAASIDSGLISRHGPSPSGSATGAASPVPQAEMLLFSCHQCDKPDSAPWDFKKKRPARCSACAL